ncbi:MAG: hypothetical protein GX058_09845 [Firmicutes bacterium]|nr:hypothetical protein [Bacillota bacterium]
MPTKGYAYLIIFILIALLGFVVPVQAGEGFAPLAAEHWAYQAVQILRQAGLTTAVPAGGELNRYEFALIVGKVTAGIESVLRQEGFHSPEQVSPAVLAKALQKLAGPSGGFVTNNAVLAYTDLRAEFAEELALLGMSDSLLGAPAPAEQVVVKGISSGSLSPGGVVTGSTGSERWEEETEFAPRYNLVFTTDVGPDMWAEAEISGDFSYLFAPDREIFPQTEQRKLTPVEIERVDLFINKETMSARLSNRLYTSLDRYTLYDQELLGGEAQVILGNLGTTVIVGKLLDTTLVTAVNGQYWLHPNWQLGGTIVSAAHREAGQSTNYGINSLLRLWPGLEVGGQYYINSEEGATALELTVWSHLAGVNLQADFTRIDPRYWSPLASGSAETYIPGSKGYRLQANTVLGKVGLSAEYGVHDYELAAETVVSREVAANLPVIPDRLEMEAKYRLVDVDALYTPDYTASSVEIGSNIVLTDQITLKAGYELSWDTNDNSYRSVNADVNVDLNDKTQLSAGFTLGKEEGDRQINHKEAGFALGYHFNDDTELTAKYRLIDFDSNMDEEDYQASQASAELKLTF